MKKVLIAVDGKKDFKKILSLFQDLTWAPEKIILLHVEQLEDNPMMTAKLGDAGTSTSKGPQKGTKHKEKPDQDPDSLLCHCRKALENGGLKNIESLIKEGQPSKEILKTAKDENVDLIILNCSEKTPPQRLATGCASKEVEETAKMPVFITKGNGCGQHAPIWN